MVPVKIEKEWQLFSHSAVAHPFKPHSACQWQKRSICSFWENLWVILPVQFCNKARAVHGSPVSYLKKNEL